MSDRLASGELTTEAERCVLAAIDQEETLALLRELISRPSENPPGQEEAKARCLEAFFSRHGIACRLDEVAPGRPNLIAELGHDDGQTLVLNGHTDTVPVGDGWTVDPFGAEVRDGRVYGRGAADMLAGVAAMSEAIVALKRSGVELRGRVVVHAVVDEEVDAAGSRRAASQIEADWVIVGEATGGRIETFGKGQLNVDITFKGRAAHSSVPNLGRNAIHDAAAFVAMVEREHDRLAALPVPVIGPATYSVGVIRGGLSGSIVPAECSLTLDRRVLPTETLEEAEADVHRLLDELSRRRPGLDATLTVSLLFPPLPEPKGQGLATTLQDVVGRLTGKRPELGGATGATDAAWYAAAGMEAVIFGPGDGLTEHQPDEYVVIEDVHEGTRALAAACARLVGPS